MNLPEIRTVRERCLFIALLLIAAVGLSFGPSLRCGFVNYDDDVFVYENPLIANGVTVQGAVDILTRIDQVFYYPLCTASFMLDSAVYGMNPFGFHLTNMLLHMANAVLLFLIFQKMTGAVRRSALTALLWAVHPLRTESVAWITERKDVLSGLFFMLTLWAYYSYVRRPFSWIRYTVILLLYLAGLMSKPMLVTLPCVLFLLDWWPLGRFAAPSRRMFLEKIPLLVMSAGFCAVTLMADAGQSTVVIENMPFPWRIGNALVSYVTYIRQMFFPSGLALPYPAENVSFVQAGFTLLFLSVFSAVAVLLRRKKPYLLTGWFWYLGMLVPVIGIVRVLGTARADRFTYLPQTGLCLLLVWAVADWCITRRRRVLVAVFTAVILAVLVMATRRQSAYWFSSETLWAHAISCTKGNSVAHSNLGAALFAQGRTEEAVWHFKEAVRLGAGQAEVFNNLGFALAETGKHGEAVQQYLSALSIDPERAEILKNLADSFVALGDAARAIRLYELAVNNKPDYTDALKNLAWILASGTDASLRNGPGAVVLAEKANALCNGRDISVLYTLAAAYAEAGHFPMAVETAHKALAAAVDRGNRQAADRIRRQLGFYQRQEPYHEGGYENFR